MQDFRAQLEKRIKELEDELNDLMRVKAREDARFGAFSAIPAAKSGNLTSFIHALLKTHESLKKDELKELVQKEEKFKDYDGRQIHFALVNLVNNKKIEKEGNVYTFLKD